MEAQLVFENRRRCLHVFHSEMADLQYIVTKKLVDLGHNQLSTTFITNHLFAKC